MNRARARLRKMKFSIWNATHRATQTNERTNERSQTMHACTTTTIPTVPVTRIASSRKSTRVRRRAVTLNAFKHHHADDSATPRDNNDAVPTHASSSFGRRAAMTIAAVSMVTPRGAEARLSGGPTGGIPIENFVPVRGWIDIQTRRLRFPFAFVCVTKE